MLAAVNSVTKLGSGPPKLNGREVDQVMHTYLACVCPISEAKMRFKNGTFESDGMELMRFVAACVRGQTVKQKQSSYVSALRRETHWFLTKCIPATEQELLIAGYHLCWEFQVHGQQLTFAFCPDLVVRDAGEAGQSTGRVSHNCVFC